jgi:hypothetical protein
LSKIALSGNASGSGTLTLSAPNTDTDRTLTLPDNTGTILTSGTPLSSFPSGFANGITSADIWRLTANISTSTDITANLEQPDTYSAGTLGASMSESSGVFTFPSTGIWLVLVQATMRLTNDISARVETQISTDGGSNWNIATEATSGNTDTLQTIASSFSVSMIDVTDTSNIKVKFSTSSFGGAQLDGSTDKNLTSFTFIRLGDT